MMESELELMKRYLEELKSNSKQAQQYIVSALTGIQEIESALKADIEMCEERLAQQDNQFWRRTYVRSVFAFVEGYSYCLKQLALGASHFWEVRLSSSEVALLIEESFDLSDKGEAMVKPSFIQFPKNIKFTLKMLARAFGTIYEPKIDGSGWHSLMEALKARNRLMHPKGATDIIVSDAESVFVRGGLNWFSSSVDEVMKSVLAKCDADGIGVDMNDAV